MAVSNAQLNNTLWQVNSEMISGESPFTVEIFLRVVIPSSYCKSHLKQAISNMGTSPCGNPLPYTDNLESPRNGEWRIPFHTGTGNHNVQESCFEVDNQVQLIFTLNRLIFLTVWLTYNLICFLQEQERSLRTLKTLGNITRSHSWLGFGLRSVSVTLKHEILVISNSNFWFVKSVALKTRGKPVV